LHKHRTQFPAKPNAPTSRRFNELDGDHGNRQENKNLAVPLDLCANILPAGGTLSVFKSNTLTSRRFNQYDRVVTFNEDKHEMPECEGNIIIKVCCARVAHPPAKSDKQTQRRFNKLKGILDFITSKHEK
jgi:hypothetical protein